MLLKCSHGPIAMKLCLFMTLPIQEMSSIDLSHKELSRFTTQFKENIKKFRDSNFYNNSWFNIYLWISYCFDPFLLFSAQAVLLYLEKYPARPLTSVRSGTAFGHQTCQMANKNTFHHFQILILLGCSTYLNLQASHQITNLLICCQASLFY